jgi:acetyl esterase/lipase
MPSIRARIFNEIVRLMIKRRDWGTGEYDVARRSRRLFGAPRISQWWAVRGMDVRQVDNDTVAGEWISVKSSDPHGIILYIHGGGFVSCSPATHRPISAGLAQLLRLRVFSVDYRLAPEHRFPAALDDVSAAYEYVRRENPGVPVAVAGDSAGGGLSLSLMLRSRDEGLELPACAVCFSPWTDLTGSGQSVRQNEDRDRMFYADTIPAFASAYVTSEGEKNNVYASPVFGDFNRTPPVLFQVGSTEVLVDDSSRIHEKIQAGGGVSELQIYDDVFHSWQMGIGLIPESDAAMKSAAEFIRRHVQKVDV